MDKQPDNDKGVIVQHPDVVDTPPGHDYMRLVTIKRLTVMEEIIQSARNVIDPTITKEERSVHLELLRHDIERYDKLK